MSLTPPEKLRACLSPSDILARHNLPDKLTATDLRKMNLPKLEAALNLPPDHEDYTLVATSQCKSCQQKSVCGEHQSGRIIKRR